MTQKMSPTRRRVAVAFLCLTMSPFLRAATPDYVSPEQTGSGEVVFRYYAPHAQTVSVAGLRGREPIAMSKGPDDVWTVKVTGLAPDIYGYSFDVDGAWVIDPRNRNFKNWITSSSAVEVTGAAPTDYSIVDVEHGSVAHHYYKSTIADREIDFYVYTPPGYSDRNSTDYPLIVLLHGSGDLASAWQESGRANFIADNLIARGSMKKAVIVMPYGHPIPQPLPANLDKAKYRLENNNAMEREVMAEILPFVETNYRISKRAEDHAIVGLSMGGGHAIWIGMAHPDVFHWIGAFSASAPEKDFYARLEPWLSELQAKGNPPHPLFFAIGKSDDLLKRNQEFTAWLKEKNVPYSWTVTDGGHEWPLWRAYFSEFAQTIFK